MTRRRVAILALGALALAAGCGKKSSEGPSLDAASSAHPAVVASASAQTIPAPPDVGAPPPDATVSPSGLASKVLTPGTGTDHPAPTDKVRVHYTGWTKAGQMFDSSVVRGQPITFGLDRVIKGWTEGLQLMVVGEKRRLWIPGALAYGDHPRPGAPAGDLVFDVELLDIIPGPKPPPAPPDVAAAPPTAKHTPSGLAYRVLTPGTGTLHPANSSNVFINYTGWTPDGKVFDTSVTLGHPRRMNLDHIIKGWSEGIQLMTKGEKARFWIPAKLAFGMFPQQSGAQAGAPTGPIVFDVELVDFQ